MENKIIKRRALVTGATGYIGTNLVRYLEHLGWCVHILDRGNKSLEIFGDIKNRVRIHHYNGTTADMFGIMSAAKPDVVFHLASLFLSDHKTEDIEPLIRSNLQFSTQLLEAMMLCGVKCIVNTGTSWQHYHSEAYNPVNLYAATKQAFECILAYYSSAHGLKSTTLILFDTYGPDDPRGKLIPLLWKTAKSKQPLKMSPGEQLIDLVYIDDVKRAFFLAAEALINTQLTPQTRYGVSSNKPIKLIELVKEFELVTGESLPIEFGKRPYRSREVMTPWSSSLQVPKWRPEISLQVGIAKSRPSYFTN